MSIPGPFTTPGTESIVASAVTGLTESAQDAVGAMIDSTLVYTDATPLLKRAAITGDVTISAGSNSATIPNNTVTLAKMQDIATASVLGRGSSGTGDPEVLAIGGDLGISSATLTDGWNIVVLASDQTTNTNNVYADLSGMSFTPTASKIIWVRARLAWTTSVATAAPRVYFVDAGNTWFSQLNVTASSGTSTTPAAGGSAAAMANLNAGGTTATYIWQGEAMLSAAASPASVKLQFTTDDGTGTVTIKKGSFIRWRAMADA